MSSGFAEGKVAVVLSGGLNEDLSLPNHVLKRCDYVINNKDAFSHVIVSSRYTLNSPQKLSPQGFVVCESVKISQFLQPVLNCPLYLDLASTDTVGSALFVRNLISNVGLFPEKLDVISSDWHIARVEAIFTWAFDLEPYLWKPEIQFVGVSDEECSQVRKNHEIWSLENFQSTFASIRDLHEAWRVLLTAHTNYSVDNKSMKLMTESAFY